MLLVDDDEVALYAWRRYLVNAGAHVMSATDGNRALAMLRQDTVDVLVADLKLPGVVDGVQLAEAARTLGRPVVAIAVTGYRASSPAGQSRWTRTTSCERLRWRPARD